MPEPTGPCHLAAVLEFCGNGVLTDELDPVPGGPVRLVDVADVIGPETGKAEEALRWLTATPLLRSLSRKRWQFAHEGIQAFLAASCLANRELAPASVLSLLFAGHGQDRYVHPAHRDVAGWLAWHQPGYTRRSSIATLRPCSARTCRRSLPPSARRSSRRCSRQPRAAGRSPGCRCCTVRITRG